MTGITLYSTVQTKLSSKRFLTALQRIASQKSLAVLDRFDPRSLLSLSAWLLSRGGGGSGVFLESQLAHAALKELGEGLAGPVLGRGASVVLDAVGEDEAHVVQELDGGGVLELVHLVPDGGQIHGVVDHVIVIGDLHTVMQDRQCVKKLRTLMYFDQSICVCTQPRA